MKKFYKKNIFSKSNYLIIFLYSYIFFSLIIFLAPYIFLGSKNYFLVGDNLDNIYADLKVLLKSGKLFSSNNSIVDQPLSGLPRSSMGSEYNLIFLFLYLFGLEFTYIAVRVLSTLVGFFGIKLLLSRYVIPEKNKDNNIVILTTSLCFSILPFTFDSFFSISAMPLVLYAFLKIREKENFIRYWLIIFIYPFTSQFAIYGFFFLFMPSLILIKDLINKKKNINFFFSIILLLLVYMFVEYRLLDQFIINKPFISHRVESYNEVNFDLYNNLKNFRNIFFMGSGNANSLQGLFISPFVLICSIFMFHNLKKEKNNKLFFFILLSILLISLNYSGFPPFSTITTFLNKIIPFNFKRFVILFPLLWFLALALVLSRLQKINSSLKFITISILLLQTLYTFKNHEYFKSKFYQNSPNIEKFFAEKQFLEIRNYINKPQKNYRVASVGLHPSIALFNGFYTVDGYFTNYPLNYKKKFRKVIEKEINKDLNLKSYFDNWGNRVYLFTPKLGRNFINKSGNQIILKDLEFDWKELYLLGARYIFSSVEIETLNIPELNFKKKFIDNSSAWDIYLYEIKKLN